MLRRPVQAAGSDVPAPILTGSVQMRLRRGGGHLPTAGPTAGGSTGIGERSGNQTVTSSRKGTGIGHENGPVRADMRRADMRRADIRRADVQRVGV